MNTFFKFRNIKILFFIVIWCGGFTALARSQIGLLINVSLTPLLYCATFFYYFMLFPSITAVHILMNYPQSWQISCSQFQPSLIHPSGKSHLSCCTHASHLATHVNPNSSFLCSFCLSFNFISVVVIVYSVLHMTFSSSSLATLGFLCCFDLHAFAADLQATLQPTYTKLEMQPKSVGCSDTALHRWQGNKEPTILSCFIQLLCLWNHCHICHWCLFGVRVLLWSLSFQV